MATSTKKKAATVSKAAAGFMKSATSRAIMETEISKVAAEFDEGQVELYKVIGNIIRMRRTASKFGEGVAFRGKFLFRRNDGKDFTSAEFIPPGDLSDEIQGAWANRPEDQGSLEFSASVSIIVDETIKPLGYSWLCEPITKIGAVNPLAALAEKVFGEVPKALAPPKD